MRSFRKWAVVAASMAMSGTAFIGLTFPQQAHAAGSPPATTLGIYTTDEDNTGQYPSSWPDNQQPDVANTYLAWGQPWPSDFVAAADVSRRHTVHRARALEGRAELRPDSAVLEHRGGR